MIIEFWFFDKQDQTFKQRYFMQWNQSDPIFTSHKKHAKRYRQREHAEKDVGLLAIAESPRAITRSIRIISLLK